MENFNLQGSIVALVTPFDERGQVDYSALKSLIDFHLTNRTNAILSCGTTAETSTLSESEYTEVIKFIVDNVAGQIPVIAGVGTNSTQKTIENCHIAKDLGIDALLVVGPYYNKPTSNGLYLHFSEIANSTDLPIIVYNVPGRTGKNIPTDVVLRLAEEFENIVAVKEASGDINQIMDILNRRPRDFKVFSGDDALTYLMMCLGSDGCISVVANQIPRKFSDMIRFCLEGDFIEARKLHFKYLNLMNINFIESNPLPVKTSLNMMGYIQENFRSPMCRMQEDNKKLLREELSDIGLINS